MPRNQTVKIAKKIPFTYSFYTITSCMFELLEQTSEISPASIFYQHHLCHNLPSSCYPFTFSSQTNQIFHQEKSEFNNTAGVISSHRVPSCIVCVPTGNRRSVTISFSLHNRCRWAWSSFYLIDSLCHVQMHFIS